MADEMTKVVCMDRPTDNSALWAALMGNKQESPAELMALLNNSNSNIANNPLWIFLFMFLFRGGMWGEGAGVANANADINRLSAQVADNQNTSLLMDAVKGNTAAISQLSTNLNCDFNSLNTAICGVRSAVDSVSAQVGYSSEKVINAINLGDANLMSKMQDCCCQQKQLIIEGNYQNQLATERQTAQIQDRLTGIANGLQQGFASTAYETQKQTCDIINASNANAQRIIDTLNGHWSLEQSQALQDAKNEISQLKQTQYLAGIIKNGCGCNGCGC